MYNKYNMHKHIPASHVSVYNTHTVFLSQIIYASFKLGTNLYNQL